MPEYDPLLTMSALNMAIVSLHRITSMRDRLILNHEYDNIINNLRMGEINDDNESDHKRCVLHGLELMSAETEAQKMYDNIHQQGERNV